jgi:hypothetical protein
MRKTISFSIIVTASFAASCSAFDPTCTLIGCGPSLMIDIVPAPTTGSFRVEALVPGSDIRRTFECPDASRCSGVAFFDDFSPEEVVIRVTTQAGTTEQTFRPSYQTFRPNGPRCEPTCRQGRIRFLLPS